MARVSSLARCRVWTLVLACLGGARAAWGAPAEGPASYDVPAECPARTQWFDALRARLPPLLRTHPLVETLDVHIERVGGASGEAYQGSLDPAGEDGRQARERAIRASTCQELIEVLSFMGALGLERIAAAEAAASDAARGSAGPAPVAAVSRIGADPGINSRIGQEPGGLSAGATAFAFVQTGIAPGQSLGLGVAAQLAWSAPGWQPLVSIGVYSGPAREVAVGGAAKVRFEHWSTQAVGCPWRFPSRGSLGLRPCIDFDLGSSRGTGQGVRAAQERAAPWLTGGLQLRLEIALWDLLELGGSVGATKPFYHARFYFRPGDTAFETPDFGFRAGSYASVLF
jgi:hypothetical protein